MIISQIIPDNSKSWVIKKNILYYNKYVLIPIANIIEDTLFISLDLRCINPILKLIINCQKQNLDFLFCDKYQIYEKNIYRENIPTTLKGNLVCLENSKFFDLVTEGKIDYIDKLIKFIERYNCYTEFKREWMLLNTYHFNRSYYDHYSYQTVYTVKRQDIRDYFNSLEREVNISMLLSE